MVDSTEESHDSYAMVLAGCNVTPQREALLPTPTTNPSETFYDVLDSLDDGGLANDADQEGSPSLLNPADTTKSTGTTDPATTWTMGPTDQITGPPDNAAGTLPTTPHLQCTCGNIIKEICADIGTLNRTTPDSADSRLPTPSCATLTDMIAAPARHGTDERKV
jgi:hypothetical protein